MVLGKREGHGMASTTASSYSASIKFFVHTQCGVYLFSSKNVCTCTAILTMLCASREKKKPNLLVHRLRENVVTPRMYLFFAGVTQVNIKLPIR